MTDNKPNILVIQGDDIGYTNLSCYSHGVMGYRTPNIDRLANEGMLFTDSYAEQSCTAGRSSQRAGVVNPDRCNEQKHDDWGYRLTPGNEISLQMSNYGDSYRKKGEI